MVGKKAGISQSFHALYSECIVGIFADNIISQMMEFILHDFA